MPDDVLTTGTAEDFAKFCNQTLEENRRHGRVPIYVSQCADYDFPHWEWGRTSDDEFDRRFEIAPPVDEESHA